MLTNNRHIYSKIYLVSAIIAFAAGIQGTVSILTVKELPNKILHMYKMIVNGKNTLEYSHLIGGVIKTVAFICIGIIVFMISRKIARNDNEPCLKSKMFLLVIVALIGMEAYRLLAFMMLDAILIIFFLLLMLIYNAGKNSIDRHQRVDDRIIIKRSNKAYCVICAILIVALLIEFLLTIYIANKYPGQFIEYL